MISAIIFDFGGVLAEGRFFPVLAEKLQDKFGVAKDLIQKRLYEHENNLMRGRETLREFWSKVCAGTEIPYADFEKAFDMKYALNEAVLGLAEGLKKKHRLVMHTDNFAKFSSAIRQDPRLSRLFDDMFFSNEIQMVKDEEAAFRHVLDNIRKEPEECVFIDDKEKNLLAPGRLGIHTVLFRDPAGLKADLAKLGVVT